MELLIEIVLQLLSETGGEALFRALGAPFERKPHPVALAAGYGLFGAVAGGLSVAIVPRAFIENPDLRLAYVCLSPLVFGALMVWLRRELFSKPVASSDGAYYCASAMFGLCFAGVRHLSIF